MLILRFTTLFMRNHATKNYAILLQLLKFDRHKAYLQ